MHLPNLLNILTKVTGDNNGKPYIIRLKAHFPHLRNERDIYGFIVHLDETIEGALSEIDSASSANDLTKEKMSNIVKKCKELTNPDNFSKAFANVLGVIPKEAEISAISMFCDMSGMLEKSVNLPEDDMTDIEKKLSDIIDEIKKSNMDESVKFHSIIRISSLISAIQGFVYLGEEVFWKEFGALSALVYRRRLEFEQSNTAKSGGSMFSRLGSVMAKAAGVMTNAESAVKSGLSIADMTGLVPKID